jgi:hypothetical protein
LSRGAGRDSRGTWSIRAIVMENGGRRYQAEGSGQAEGTGRASKLITLLVEVGFMAR